MCKISVVVPVYNVEKHIKKCIDSILKQTFQSYEIIVVNDGSIDSSVSIVENLKSEKIRIINKKNAGLPQARKTGLEHATGEYVFFVDADDWIESDTLQVLIDTIEKYDAEVACCDIALDDAEGNCIEILKSNKIGEYAVDEAVEAIHDITGVYTYMWNKLFKRSILKSEYFPTGHFVGEDYCTLFPILLDKTPKIVQCDKVLYHYVQHGGNMTKAGFGESFRLSYEKFHEVEAEVLQKYPGSYKSIKSYILVQDMAVLNSMMRNGIYDKNIMQNIIYSIRKELGHFVFNPHMKVLYRGSAFVIAIHWKLYRSVYLWILKRAS